ncbi:hypothetical protein [Rhizobium sp. H4]|uniref:hypothetical protein n=1 Tax=Rhizobium sp. H4 TaxID=2035449 RepID=UPI001FDF3656|nr:hypothetical protein [Rhizobium sp. H4]
MAASAMINSIPTGRRVMPCELKINVTEVFTGFTVEDDQKNPYTDKKNVVLKNLTTTSSSIFEITVELDEKNQAVVYVEATNAKSVASSSTYNIPDDCAPGGNIYVPKIAAASQSDLDNLDAKVNALAQQIAGNKRGK